MTAMLFDCRAYIIRIYLPLAFAVAFIISMAWPLPGQVFLKPAVMGVHVITFINICIVFFISGLTLRTDELKAAFSRTAAVGQQPGCRQTMQREACMQHCATSSA
eukprot:GHRR01029057.1.p4 GENE.GHRR01029057.1~~GHRR01029057.1.p4  ORF type:complete len:105 (+),score=29.74 GHRR01029057.1:147-461(+)